jgi:hypothetical protein
MSNNPRSVEAKIARLILEMAKINECFYEINTEDRVGYAGMLERKRDDMVRSIVLQMHTAIDDLLTSLVICGILKIKRCLGNDRNQTRSKPALALRRIFLGTGVGFDTKLNVAVTLGVFNQVTKGKLTVLNTLRNKCSHNWILKAPVRRGKRPHEKKLPLLSYKTALMPSKISSKGTALFISSCSTNLYRLS